MVITGVLNVRPARVTCNRIVRDPGLLPVGVPDFPLDGAALTPLRAQADPAESTDYAPLWSGQASRFGPPLSAGDLTRRLAQKNVGKAYGRADTDSIPLPH